MSEYECDGCGACCRTYAIYASMSDSLREPRLLAEGKRVTEFENPDWAIQLYPLPFHESCCFLAADNRCSIYQTRPEVCREFAAGSPQCQEARECQRLLPLEPISSQGELKIVN